MLSSLLFFAVAATAQDEPADLSAQAVQAVESAKDSYPVARSAIRRSFRWGIDDLLFESGSFWDAHEAKAVSALRGSPYASWNVQRQLELRVGLRLEAVHQAGGVFPYSESRGDYAESFLRYGVADTRITVGAQKIIWGRVDAIPLADRVSRADLSRFALDELNERRRSLVALRWEQSAGDYKIDTVALPAFRGAWLPDQRSVWSPINRSTGEIIGIAPTPLLAAMVKSSSVRREEKGSGGVALRLTRTGTPPVDYGITLAHTRQSLPYYRMDLSDATFTSVHPFNKFFGVDVEFVTGDYTWRSEFGYTKGVSATLPDARMISAGALEWVGAVEFFPGGRGTRVNFQILARKLRTGFSVLELKEYYGVNGEVEAIFAQGRWKLSTRFFNGLNVRDVYLAPKISYLGIEPYEFYATARLFDGEARTFGGFHRTHRNVAIGVKTRF